MYYICTYLCMNAYMYVRKDVCMCVCICVYYVSVLMSLEKSIKQRARHYNLVFGQARKK